MVGYDVTVALNDVGEILEGVVHLARPVDCPCLPGLAQEMFHTLADDAVADVQHEVGHVAVVVLNKTDSFIQIWIHRLTGYEHGALRLHEHAYHMVQRVRGYVGRHQLYLAFLGQRGLCVIEQRFSDGDIDMHRGTTTSHQCLVDQTVAIPARVGIVRLGQRYCLSHETA